MQAGPLRGRQEMLDPIHGPRERRKALLEKLSLSKLHGVELGALVGDDGQKLVLRAADAAIVLAPAPQPIAKPAGEDSQDEIRENGRYCCRGSPIYLREKNSMITA